MKIKGSIFTAFVLFLFSAASTMAQGLIVNNGTYLVANNSNLILQGGNLTNNGSISLTGSLVTFSGTTQSINGTIPLSFNNLKIASGTTSINTAGQTLAGYLMSNGTLNANNNITLLATASRQAIIDGSGTGQVLGNLTMQGYVPSGYGYKYLSSPFKAATVNQLSNETNLTAAFPLVYKYDESLASSGWAKYTTTTDILSPFKGYAVNLGNASTAPKTIDITGEVNNGTISSTLFNNNKFYTKGFNLVGNPYPSAIDWNSASGWIKTNIDNAIYLFKASTTDQYGGTYSSYVGGISSDGLATNIISPMQAFFVHVTDGTYPVSASLSINNQARITSQSAITIMNDHTGRNKVIASTRSTTNSGIRPLIRLSASFDTNASVRDAAVIYFDDFASRDFEREKDALKMMNTDPDVPSLYSISKDENKLSISAIPHPGDSSRTIPLGIQVEKAGFISLNLQSMENIPSNLNFFLVDAKTGVNQNLKKNPTYSANLEKGNHNNRFSIVLTFDDKIVNPEMTTEWFKATSIGNRILVTLTDMQGDDNGELLISNMLGQVLYRQKLSSNGSHELSPGLENGTYVLRFTSQKKGMRAGKVLINNEQ